LAPLSVAGPRRVSLAPLESSRVITFTFLIQKTLNSAIMSDYEEDEMDVDGPVLKDEITFSSNNVNSKGKRSAANLPVEAEDSLPW